jgi:cadmium resistance protein CadD (predicted permease)
VRQIIGGQYLGMAILVAASIGASAISLVLAPKYVGLLGVLPILIGLKELYELRKGGDEDDDDEVRPRAGVGNLLAVVLITVANGGDNIGVYTPVFATSTPTQIGIFAVTFMLMVAPLLGFSHWLVNHPSLGAPIRRCAHWLMPLVLIAVGVWVMVEARPTGG